MSLNREYNSDEANAKIRDAIVQYHSKKYPSQLVERRSTHNPMKNTTPDADQYRRGYETVTPSSPGGVSSNATGVATRSATQHKMQQELQVGL